MPSPPICSNWLARLAMEEASMDEKEAKGAERDMRGG